MQPIPAAVTAWRKTLSTQSPAAKIPGSDRELCQGLREMEMRHASSINVESEDTDSARNYLRGLEHVWSDSIQFGRC